MSPPNPLTICPFEQIELVRDALRVVAGHDEDRHASHGPPAGVSPFVESVLAMREGYSLLAAMLQSAHARLDATLRRLKCQPGDLQMDHDVG